jgi:hypothetical protein
MAISILNPLSVEDKHRESIYPGFDSCCVFRSCGASHCFCLHVGGYLERPHPEAPMPLNDLTEYVTEREFAHVHKWRE